MRGRRLLRLCLVQNAFGECPQDALLPSRFSCEQETAETNHKMLFVGGTMVGSLVFMLGALLFLCLQQLFPCLNGWGPLLGVFGDVLWFCSSIILTSLYDSGHQWPLTLCTNVVYAFVAFLVGLLCFCIVVCVLEGRKECHDRVWTILNNVWAMGRRLREEQDEQARLIPARAWSEKSDVSVMQN